MVSGDTLPLLTSAVSTLLSVWAILASSPVFKRPEFSVINQVSSFVLSHSLWFYLEKILSYDENIRGSLLSSTFLFEELSFLVNLCGKPSINSIGSEKLFAFSFISSHSERDPCVQTKMLFISSQSIIVSTSQSISEIQVNRNQQCRSTVHYLETRTHHSLYLMYVFVSNAYQWPYLLHVQHLSLGEGPLLPRPSNKLTFFLLYLHLLVGSTWSLSPSKLLPSILSTASRAEW